jgi:dienelactone hydrolase
MRRGWGQSGGAYVESYQYGREASGMDRAVEDLDGVFRFLREQPWANPNQILIGGQSRGGLLAVVYAWGRPEAVKGVINFVGGWMSEGCVPHANEGFFREATRQAVVPTLWLYADQDQYYSAAAIRRYRASFEEAGGPGPFYLVPDLGGNGHFLVNKPLSWRPAVDAYLRALGLRTAPRGGGD